MSSFWKLLLTVDWCSAMTKLVSFALMERVVRAVRILNYKRCYVMGSAYRLTTTPHIVDLAEMSVQNSIIVWMAVVTRRDWEINSK